MRGRAAELALRRVFAPLFGEVSAEARARVGVDPSRVSAGPSSFGERVRPRAARCEIDNPSSRIRRLGDIVYTCT